MWNKVLDEDARSRLVSNIVGHASWEDIEPDMKNRVAEGLGVGALSASR